MKRFVTIMVLVLSVLLTCGCGKSNKVEVADVNGDDEVDSDDLTKHARYVGGIITDWSQE